MEQLKALIKYLKLNFLFTKITNPKEISEPIVKGLDEVKKAIKDKEYETINPSDISAPIVGALAQVKKSIDDKETPLFPEFPDLKPEFSKLNETFREEIQKLDKEVIVKNDFGQLLSLFKSNKDKGDILKVLKEIRDKETEQIDYTMILDELIKAVENKNIDLSRIETLLEDLNKEYPAFPEYFKLDKGQLAQLVPISMMHTKALNLAGAQVNPATEEKQDPLASYQLANFDASSNPIYIGKVDKDGKWLIKYIDMTAEEALFAKGDSDFATSWSGRYGLTYEIFNNVF